MSQRTKVGQWSKQGGWKSMKALPAAKAFSGRSNRSNRSDATPGSDELPLLMSRCPSFSEKSRSVASRRSVDFPACPMLSLLLRVHLSDRIHVATSKRMQNETKCHQVDVKTISQNLVISKILLALVVLVNLVPFSSCWYCWSNRVHTPSYPHGGLVIFANARNQGTLDGLWWPPRGTLGMPTKVSLVCKRFLNHLYNWPSKSPRISPSLKLALSKGTPKPTAILGKRRTAGSITVRLVCSEGLQDSTVTEVSWVYVAIIWQSYCQAIYIYII